MNNNKSKFIASLHGASRNHNYGDVLLMAIYKSWIEEAGGEVIMDMANSYYGEYLGVEHSIPIKEAVKKADVIVYGGGGYFGEPRKPSLRWRTKFVLHHMMPGILARMKGKPYAFFGIGFGPLNNWIIRKIGMYVINGAKLVSVRDDESRDYLKKYGYKGVIHVNPDSALSIADGQSKYHFKKTNSLGAKKKIALHLPLDPGGDYDRFKNSLLSFLTKLSDNVDAEFVFLIDHGLGKSCYQYKFFNAISKELNVDWAIKEYSDPEDTLSFIASCDYVLTTKLHVAITSYALGVTPIGISKHPKTTRFFKQVGLSKLHCDLEELLNVDLYSRITQLIAEDITININEEIVKSALRNKGLVADFCNNK